MSIVDQSTVANKSRHEKTQKKQQALEYMNEKNIENKYLIS